MKKSVLFAIIATILIGLNSVKAQSSCPTIITSTIQVIVHPTDPCQRKVSFDFINPTSGQKRLGLIVTVNGSQVINDCIDASGQQGVQRNYTSSYFAACAPDVIDITINPYSSNTCGGTPCAPPSHKTTAGAPLPVTFGSFTATKSYSSVVLKWETLTEINNSGFAVERNTNGSWDQIAFVFSVADNGTSNSKLSYQYTDVNTSKGITQYRIRQVDFNGNSKYSEIRAVRSDDQIAKTTVFPNPSVDGKVMVLYSDASQRDITLFDMTGRAVKQWRNYSNNTLQIDNLVSGMYNLRSSNVENNTTSTNKIIVSR